VYPVPAASPGSQSRTLPQPPISTPGPAKPAAPATASSAAQLAAYPCAVSSVAKSTPAQAQPARTKKRRSATSRSRLPERCASGVAAVLATVLLAWLANPAVSSAKPAVLSPVREAARTLALEVRLDRLPATLSLATTLEGKLDPGPLVGSDRANVVADALAALPVSQGMATATRRDDEITGNLLVPLGLAGGDPTVGLALDPTGAGAGTLGKATFMGAEATGRRFMIIADRSASMNGAKFDRVIAEIAKTIKGLKPSAKFYVIFYDYLALPCPAKRWLSGSSDAAALQRWMENVGTSGGTQPLPAFQIALSQIHPRPDAIFFMTDGLFPANVADMIPKMNSARRIVPIHSISFVDKSSESLLRRIADDSKGTYRHVDLDSP
jgi:hypothetical protein